jgi:UDP-GlcNAc:undecaprenyl-phosphate/decaprenyl-phosphate GlcNAc-1-phosphate transferase
MGGWQLVFIWLASLAAAQLVVITKKWHEPWTGDFENSGVQKHHAGSPPRIGSIPLMCGVALGILYLARAGLPHTTEAARTLGLLLLASLPVVLLGLAEDVTKKVSVRVRFFGAVVSALLAIALLHSRILRADVPLLDSLLQFAPLSMLFTVFMVCGYTNAMNIVDGLNGLAGGLALLMLGATAVVASQFGDSIVVELCVVIGMAVFGFLLVNFPRGLIFLGDGGAYFIGFALVEIWILLLSRNPAITPWFVVAVGFHPTIETIFSIIRRWLRQGIRIQAASAPDMLHFHSVMYRRCLQLLRRGTPLKDRWKASALASIIVLLFAAVPILAALVAPSSVAWNLGVVAVAGIAFVSFGTWLVRLQGPEWKEAGESITTGFVADSQASSTLNPMPPPMPPTRSRSNVE